MDTQVVYVLDHDPYTAPVYRSPRFIHSWLLESSRLEMLRIDSCSPYHLVPQSQAYDTETIHDGFFGEAIRFTPTICGMRLRREGRGVEVAPFQSTDATICGTCLADYMLTKIGGMA